MKETCVICGEEILNPLDAIGRPASHRWCLWDLEAAVKQIESEVKPEEGDAHD